MELQRSGMIIGICHHEESFSGATETLSEELTMVSPEENYSFQVTYSFGA